MVRAIMMSRRAQKSLRMQKRRLLVGSGALPWIRTHRELVIRHKPLNSQMVNPFAISHMKTYAPPTQTSVTMIIAAISKYQQSKLTAAFCSFRRSITLQPVGPQKNLGQIMYQAPSQRARWTTCNTAPFSFLFGEPTATGA